MAVIRRIQGNARACAGALATATTAAAVTGVVAPPTSAEEPADVPLSDISDEQLKRDAASRFSAQGAEVNAAELVVERGPDGDVLIRPRNLAVQVNPDGSETIDVSFPRPDDVGGSQGEIAALAPVLWHGSTECYARLTDDTAWIDACHRWTGIEGDDGNPDSWYPAIDVWGTAGGLGHDLAFVEVQETTGGASWTDWQPRSDYNGECRGDSLGLEVGEAPVVLTYSTTFERCETYDITKYNPEVHFKSEWRGGGVFFTQDREVRLMSSWAMPADYKESRVTITRGIHDVYS